MTPTQTSLFLRPVDVWLFRDGRPFSAGSDHFADTLFPPLPTVIQGALRGHYLALQNVPLGKGNEIAIKNAVGTGTDFLQLRIRGPFISRGKDVYFPLPADVIKNAGKWERLKPEKIPMGIYAGTSMPQLLVSHAEPDKLNYSSFMLNQKEMNNYLSGSSFTPSDEKFYQRETRVGIAQDSPRRVTKSGALYTVNFIRMEQDAGLHVQFSGLANWKAQKGVMRFGGEGHAAYFEQMSLSAPLPTPPTGIKNRFKLVFITPTYFQQGWQPDTWSRFFSGGPITLEAAALQRYLSAGGYDLAANVHKPALRFVPAGSVYYFSAKADVKLTQDWVCDSSPDGAPLGHIGFGQVMVGTW